MQCTVCGKDTAQLCKTCSCSAYCSRECQKADWPIHKLLCSQLQNSLTPPEASHKRGILFPADSKTPIFVWVPPELNLTADTEPASHQAFFQHLIGTSAPGKVTINRGGLRSRALSNEIMVLDDGSSMGQVNSCILALTSGLDVFVWHGTVLAMKLARSGDPGRYANMDTVDFRNTVNLFRSHPAEKPTKPEGSVQIFSTRADVNRVRKPPPIPFSRGRLPAVKINCNGDQKVGGRPKFEAITVAKDHPVFRAPVTKISNLVGFPIRVIKCTINETLRRPHFNKATFDPDSTDATFLQLNPDPNDDGPWGWGWAPEEWQGAAGSVIVVRKDLQVLYTQHLEAFCYYCHYILNPLFEDSSGGGLHPDRPMKRSDVVQRMTPREFENFYMGYDDAKRSNDPNWSTRIPYLVLD